MRQTNIIWVAMVLGCTVMDKIVSQTLPFISGSEKRSTVSYSYWVIGIVKFSQNRSISFKIEYYFFRICCPSLGFIVNVSI